MAKRPEGFHTITPFLVVSDANGAIELYKSALKAEELGRLNAPDSGKVMHAAIRIGDSIVFMCDEMPQMGMLAPKGVQAGSRFYVYVDDVDKSHSHAAKNGLSAKSAPEDMFWGDRTSVLTDPYGQTWTLATKQREVSMDEMKQAMKAMA